jgi:hypothetical protein
MMETEDPERMPVHEPAWSYRRRYANGARLGAIVWLSLQGAYRDFYEWRHPPVCPYCRARIAETELHCHLCGADLPEMMFRSPAEGVRFEAIAMGALLGTFVVLSWLGRGRGPIYGWWLRGMSDLFTDRGWVPPALRH